MGNNVTTNVRSMNAIKQPGQFQSSHQSKFYLLEIGRNNFCESGLAVNFFALIFSVFFCNEALYYLHIS